MSAPTILWQTPPPPPPRRVSLDEYEEAEQSAETKSEYLDGVVRAMPGASPRHLLITPMLGQILGPQLRGKGGLCVYLDQDVRIAMPKSNAYTYPDGAIACPPQFLQKPRGAITNPRVIIEVLSPALTEGYDRGPKFRRYRDIETLEDYVLISTAEPLVEVFSRPEWGPRTYEGLEASALIPFVGIELPLAELYALALSIPEE